MSSKTNGTRRTKAKGPITFAVVIGLMLVVIIAGIEIVRRFQSRPVPTTIGSEAASVPFPREIRDAAGQSLTIAAPPKRIVSQTLGTDEILLAICPADRIIALSNLAEDDKYSNVVELARQVPGRTTEGAEQIYKLQPDLIFVASYSRAETVELLKASHAPVFRFANFDSIADIKSNIRIVGHATGCDAEAEKLIKKMDSDLEAIKARIPKGRSPLRVMSYGREGYTAGANSLFDEIVRAAGAVNLSAEHGLKGFAKINVEKIADWQPDVIVAGGNHDDLEIKRKQLLADPVIAASPAGKTGRVFVMDNRHFLTVSQYVVKAVEDLANALYGNQQ